MPTNAIIPCMADLPPDPDLDELPAELRDAGALRIVGTDADTGARVEGVVYADHLAEGLADARRARDTAA
jgi:hypothetical protein